MKWSRRLLLGLFLFCVLAPVISFGLRTILYAQDSLTHDSAIEPIKTVSTTHTKPIVYTMEIDGAIGTVTVDRIADAIDRAEKDNAELLVILMDTPGGLTKSTWAITKNMLNSHVPICVYIAPSGARAGSAGVFITYAANFAAMASSTNIGAAHVVSGDGQKIDSIMNEKLTNDAVASIKASAQKRGRNADWAEQAVRESKSITDSEALALNVINFRAENLDSLLNKLNGQVAETPKGTDTLHLVDADVRPIATSFVERFLDIITQPDIAFILFSIGGLGLVLELYNPGSILPGVVGAISLILAFYAFQTLPINYAGLALMILAGVLFIAEIKVISHGLLTIGGLIALFLGGLMLYDSVDPSIRVGMDVLITVVVLIGASVGLAGWLALKAQRHKPFSGQEGLIGKTADVRANGFVYVNGALWKAEASEILEIGAKVEVIGVEGLKLKVKRIVS
jgi:membrane-bound serine protease (ClpP class)